MQTLAIHSSHVPNDLKFDGVILFTVDCIVDGSIEATYVDALGSIEASYFIEVDASIRAAKDIKAGVYIEAGKTIDAKGSIEAGMWIKAGKFLKAGGDVIAQEYISAGRSIRVGGTVESTDGAKVKVGP